MIAIVAISAFAAPYIAAMAPTFFAGNAAALAGASTALASGTVTAIGGGSMEDVLKSAVIGGTTAFFGAPGGPVSNFVGRSGITNAAGNAAISSGIVGTGIGLLSGQKLQDAVKSGVTAGAISGLTTAATNKGFDAQIEMPTAPTVGEMLDKDAQATQPDPKDQVFSKPNYDNFRPVDAGDARGLPVVNPGEQMQIVPTSDLSSTGPDNSAYTGGRTSMGPAYDTGFGPGRMGPDNSAYTGTTSTGSAYDTGFGTGRPDAGSAWIIEVAPPVL
jgi:hypothetical protein